MDELQDEMILIIFSFLPDYNRILLADTCKKYHFMAKSLYDRKFRYGNLEDDVADMLVQQGGYEAVKDVIKEYKRHLYPNRLFSRSIQSRNYKVMDWLLGKNRREEDESLHDFRVKCIEEGHFEQATPLGDYKLLDYLMSYHGTCPRYTPDRYHLFQVYLVAIKTNNVELYCWCMLHDKDMITNIHVCYGLPHIVFLRMMTCDFPPYVSSMDYEELSKKWKPATFAHETIAYCIKEKEYEILDLIYQKCPQYLKMHKLKNVGEWYNSKNK